jgi:hypothetical protein
VVPALINVKIARAFVPGATLDLFCLTEPGKRALYTPGRASKNSAWLTTMRT